MALTFLVVSRGEVIEPVPDVFQLKTFGAEVLLCFMKMS
jgi:hypothetical protein